MTYATADGRCSVIGGYVYRGATPTWQGLYFHGDFCSGELFAADLSIGAVEANPVLSGVGNISAFGEGTAGELYVVTLNGTIARIVASDVIFASGFE